jgi:hypothetical protein
MTTTLKPIARETLSTFRNRALLELHSTYLKVRQKGKRTRFTVTYDQLWTLGARNAAEATRQERIAKRKAAKNAK